MNLKNELKLTTEFISRPDFVKNSLYSLISAALIKHTQTNMIPSVLTPLALLVFIVIIAALLIYLEKQRRKGISAEFDSESPSTLNLNMYPHISRHLNLTNYTIERVDRSPGSIFIVLRESLSKYSLDEDKPPSYEQATHEPVDTTGTSSEQTEHGDTIHNSFVFKVN